MRLTRFLPALAAGLMISGAAFALDAAAPAPAPALAPSVAKAPAPAAPPVAAPAQSGGMTMPETETGKKAKSQDCYRQADAQNLHGKPRKEFHRACMKG